MSDDKLAKDYNIEGGSVLHLVGCDMCIGAVGVDVGVGIEGWLCVLTSRALAIGCGSGHESALL